VDLLSSRLVFKNKNKCSAQTKAERLSPQVNLQFHFVLTRIKRIILDFFFFFSELGTEPRALRFLGKRSTTKLNPQPLRFIFILYSLVFCLQVPLCLGVRDLELELQTGVSCHAGAGN